MAHLSPLGKNTLRNIVANLCREAEIGGQRTKHSLRATTFSLGLIMGVPDVKSKELCSARLTVAALLFEDDLPKFTKGRLAKLLESWVSRISKVERNGKKQSSIP